MTSFDLAIVFGPLFALVFVMIILFGAHHYINKES
jgi:hypothetical protein